MAGSKESKPRILKTPMDFVNWLDTTSERTPGADDIDRRYRQTLPRCSQAKKTKRRTTKAVAQRAKRPNQRTNGGERTAERTDQRIIEDEEVVIPELFC
jgi:hypothetical protein